MRVKHSVALIVPLLLCMLSLSHAQQQTPIGVPVPPEIESQIASRRASAANSLAATPRTTIDSDG